MGFVRELLVVLQPLRLLLPRTIYFLLLPASRKTTIWPKERGRRLEKGHQENSVLPPLSCLQLLTSIQSSQNSNPSSQSIDQLEGTPGKLKGTEQIRTALVCLVHPAPQLVIWWALCLPCPEAGPGPSQDLTGIGCLSPTSKLNVSAFSYQVETPSPGYNTLNFQKDPWFSLQEWFPNFSTQEDHLRAC